MKLIRMAGVAASLCVSLVLIGCGDVYRPVVNPFTQPGGDPANASTAYVASEAVVQPPNTGVTNSVCDTLPCPGTVLEIDAPNDVAIGGQIVGRSPVHLIQAAGEIWTANRDDNTVTAFSTITSSTPQTVSLPPGSAPSFLATTETAAIYVALPGTDPNAPGNVGVITPGTNTLNAGLIPVGNNPTAMVETPDQKKLYVVNTNSGTVTSIAALDKKVLKTIPVGTQPIWALATADSGHILVLNRNNGAKGSVSVISTATDSVVATLSVGASTDLSGIPLNSPMAYDSHLQRLYVANSTDDTLSAFDVSVLPSQPIELPGSPVALGNASANPVSVVPLPDGSRVYVANVTAGTVSVVDAKSLTLKKTIPVGTQTVAVAAAADSTKVLAVNHLPTVQMFTNAAGTQVPVVTQQPGTTTIRTSTDSVVTTVPSPFEDSVNCTQDTPQPWLPGHSYALGTIVAPSTSNGKTYQVSTAGTSGSSEPASWCTTTSCTVTDGTVTWTERDVAPLTCPRQQPWYIAVY